MAEFNPMKAPSSLSENGEVTTPEDVATLYSWANLHGAKYRDFSASRAEAREEARLRVEEALAEQRRKEAEEAERRAQEEAQIAARQAAEAAEAARQAEAERLAEIAHQAEAERQAVLAAQEAQRQAVQQRAWQPAPAEARYGQPVREAADMTSGPAWLAPETPVGPVAPAPSAALRQPQFTGQGSASTETNPAYSSQFRSPAHPSYAQMPQATPNPPYGAGQNHIQSPAPVDELLHESRDRTSNRWYALKGVFDPQAAAEPTPAQPPVRVPVLAVFSLAGGVGKTSLAASLGRALSSRGERVLLVDTAAYGLLPFFFGAREQRPGQLRTFNPPGASADAPIQLVTFDPESRPQDYAANQPQMDPQAPRQDWLTEEVGRYSHGVNRVLIDLPTASGATTRRILWLAPVVLVPVLPDMNSVVSVGAIEGFFRNNASQPELQPGGQPVMPFYVLNQFDYSLPLHLDVREILREQIGDRLIPIALRRSPSISEALAEGMTVIDYAPTSVVAEDYANLAGWVRSVSAPAMQTHRGVRWSER